jgi:ATP-dependent helicase/nuclease subunit A
MQNVNYCENIAEISELINRVKTLELPYDEINPERILNAINNVKKFMQTDSKLIKEAQFVMKTNYGKLTNSEDDIDVLIQGVIDLVILNKNNAIIIDFKTNKTHNKKYLIDHYGLQLKMYAEAFEKAYKIKVDKKLLYSFEMNDFIEA